MSPLQLSLELREKKFNTVLCVIYVSNIPTIRGIFKIISLREKRKAKRHLSSSWLPTSRDRSRHIASVRKRKSARATNNPRPKNLPRKKKSATIGRRRGPGSRGGGKRRGKEPTPPAKSGSLAWIRDFKKRPARRPAYSINAPRPRSGEGTREREKGDGKGRASNEVAGKKVRRIKEGDKTAGDVSSFAAPASSSASLSHGRRRRCTPHPQPPFRLSLTDTKRREENEEHRVKHG